MIQSEEIQKEVYLRQIENNSLGKTQAEVFKAIFEFGPITDQELSDLLDLPLATVNGRRKELFDLAIVKEEGKKFNSETNSYRTLWVIHDGSKDSLKPHCASFSEMERVHKIILNANPFQKSKIIEWASN